MRQVKPFLIGNRVNPPLLHGQGSKKHLNGFSILILAEFIDDHGMSEYFVSVNFGDQIGTCAGFVMDPPSADRNDLGSLKVTRREATEGTA
jgi:hypothetical protein